jgi:hypothetical protein
MTISISSPASFRVMAGISRGGVIELNWGWKEVEERGWKGGFFSRNKERGN